MSQISSQVPTVAAHIRPLLIGVAVPESSLLTERGDPLDLTAALAERPAVLVFYRGSW